MSSSQYKTVTLAAYATGYPTSANFTVTQNAVPEDVNEGEILVRVLYLSVDPYMRGRIGGEDHRTSSKSVRVGDVIPGATVGQVIKSKCPDLKPGSIVHSYSGWREYYVSLGTSVTICVTHPSLPLSLFTGTLGMTGLTAYYGLMKVIEPKKGETIVVSAAAGAVGAIVGQIAKIMGCRVVGIAGGVDKCTYITKELGFDAAVDYKSSTFESDLSAALPDGVDGYFDNSEEEIELVSKVGGTVSDLVIPKINRYARIAICGQISTYNQKESESTGPRLFHHLIWKMAKIQGFLVQQWANENEKVHAQLSEWLLTGQLKSKEDIMEGGIEKAPDALIKLFQGTNFGKQSVHINEPLAL